MNVETGVAGGVVVPAVIEVDREGALVVLHVRASVKLAPGSSSATGSLGTSLAPRGRSS